MSNRVQSFILVILIIGMALASFAAGYVVRDTMGVETAGVERPGVVGEVTASSLDSEFTLFNEAWHLVNQSFFGELPEGKRVEYGAIRGALDTLADPYTIFIEPPERQAEIDRLSGNFGGIGARLQRNEAGEIELTVIPGNPAEAAGILDGDILVAVDGIEITAEMSVGAIAQQIRGERGTEVVLSVIHPGESEPVDVVVERGNILLPSVTSRIVAEEPVVGYIDLDRFSGESGNEVKEAIEGLLAEGAEAIILDLRNNGGGLLDAAVSVSDHFLDEVPVLYQQSRGQGEQTFFTTDETIAGDVPLLVLVNQGTASAAEIVAGALMDHERARLLGAQTFGKGSVQLVYDLSDGSSVHITAAKWLTPNRQQIDQQGLVPDEAITITQEDVDNGRDPVLERAIEIFANEL
ncbi:MAG TPA: S41 family peptidase [Anaerolineae bacterium]|nr:S41 family peptidase [Anaerolineae bacterium]